MSTNKQTDIFLAATHLFAKRGYDGTTVPMIAEKANVGAGTIYRYFDNKEFLVNDLFIKCVGQFSDALITDFPTNASIHEQFTHIFNKIFELARNNVDTFIFINSHDDGHYLNDDSKKTFDGFMDFIIGVIEEGKKQQIIRPLPSEVVIAIVYAPIILLVKAIEKNELTYSPEVIKDLEVSLWDAIRII